MADGNQPARPPWLDIGKRPTRLMPVSSVLVALALVVLGGGLAAAAMRGSSPSTILGPGATMRPVAAGGSNGFPQTISCSSVGARWTCVPGRGGSYAYRLLAAGSDGGSPTLLILGTDSTDLPPPSSGSGQAPPNALVCAITAGALSCDPNSLPSDAGARAIYARAFR
jgi:hypothetical protein